MAATSIQLFNRWSYDDVEIGDISLEDYIAVKNKKHCVYLPHTAGRYARKRFRKVRMQTSPGAPTCGGGEGNRGRGPGDGWRSRAHQQAALASIPKPAIREGTLGHGPREICAMGPLLCW